MILETAGVLAGVLALSSIKIVDQYERGIVFTFGKFSRALGPGLNFVLPVVQNFRKLDIRVNAIPVPKQDTMTKDNISVQIDAVLYYRVEDVKTAVLKVEDYGFATYQIAQTTLRYVVGETTLDELLSNREEISKRIYDLLTKTSEQWGIKIQAVELKDIQLPSDLVRIIGKEAEAEREKRAVIIKAEGELEAAKNLTKAASELSEIPGGLHIRMLQTINNLGNEKSETNVITTPSEVLRAIVEKISK